MGVRPFRTDLHVHTCLSPCGELEMTPQAIVRKCGEKDIRMIAVCDHNSAENVSGVQKAAAGTNLTALAGMEVTTAEEVHILAIFDDEKQALELQDIVYTHLVPGKNDEELFGIQVVSNENDEVKDIVDKLLIGGTTLPLDHVIDIIHQIGGLAIPSHIDRESYSLLGQLGMIPESLKADALEVSAHGDIQNIRQHVSGSDRYPIITSSDSHRLSDIGKASTFFYLAEPTIGEIRKAFQSQDGRKILEEKKHC
jgi:predicted metal-dependent phosphoesterase TrpH